MRRSFGKFIRYSANSLAALFVWQLYISCGPGWTEEDYRMYVFQPNVESTQGLEQFFFTNHYLWKLHEVEDYGDSHGYDRNAREWYEYFDKQVPLEQIEYFLYSAEPAEVRAVAEGNTSKSPRLGSDKSRSPRLQQFHDYLKEANPDALCYLLYAKECEALFTRGFRHWWHQNIADTTDLIPLREKGAEAFGKTKDPFLKQRLGYQLEKISHYLNDDEAVIRHYEKHVEPFADASEVISEWGSYYYALAVKNSLSGAKGDYLLSKTFDRSVDKRLPAVKKFSGEVEQVLAYAGNEHEKAVIMTMKALQYPAPAMAMLKQIYEWDPQLEYFDELLVREVNKLEDWIMTARHVNFKPESVQVAKDNAGGSYRQRLREAAKKNQISDSLYVLDLNEFLETVIKDGERKNPDFLHLVKGHVYLLINRPGEAGDELDKAAKLPSSSKEIKRQIHITNLLKEIMEVEKPDAGFEKRIAADLQWLNTNSDSIYESERVVSSLLLVLRNKYLADGQKGRTALLQQHIQMLTETDWRWFSGGDSPVGILDEWGRPEDIQHILDLYHKKDKTAFEQFILSTHKESYNRNDLYDRNKRFREDFLYDLQGTLYLRQGNFEAAAASFRKIPQEYWQQWPYDRYLDTNPFRIWLYQKEGEPLPLNQRYTKLTFTERMIRLEDSVRNYDEDRAKNYFLLANASYNTSFHGNSWILLRRYWTRAERPNSASEFDRAYFGNTRALLHYQKAMAHSENDTLTSFCARMARRCRDNYQREFNTSDKEARQLAKPVDLNWHYHKGDTNTFRGVIRECYLYEKYLNEMVY